jgi:LysM repeat protein
MASFKDSVGVDFSKTGISDIPASRAPSAGLPQSTANITSGVNKQATAAIVTSVADSIGKVAKAVGPFIQKAQTGKFVNSFTQEQLKIASAVDQGLMSSERGRMLMRSNFTRYSASNPSYVGELAEAHKTIVGTAGLGKVVADGTTQEQQFNKMKENAFKDGFGNPYQEEEGQRASVGLHQEYIAKKNMLEMESKSVGLKRDKLNLAGEEVKKNQLNTLKDMSNIYFNNIGHNIEGWENALKSGEDPAVIVGQARRALAELDQSVAQISGQLDSETVKRQVAGTRQLLENFIQFGSGGDKTVYENSSDLIIARARLGVLTDNPDVPEIVAKQGLMATGLNMSPEGLVSQIQLGAALFSGVDKGGSDKIVGGSGNTEDDLAKRKGYYKTLGDITKNIVNGTFDGKSPEEFKKQVNGAFKSINTYQLAVEDPKQYKDFVNFVASSNFLQYIKNNPDAIPSEMMRSVSDIIKREYIDVALPIFKQEYENQKVRLRKPVVGERSGLLPIRVDDNKEAFTATWKGDGLVFELTDRFKNPVSADRSGASEAIRQAKDLNKRLAQPLNQLVKTAAHLEGHNNYQEVWEKDFAPRIGLSQEAPKKPGEPKGQVDEPVKDFSDKNSDIGDQKTDLSEPLIDEGITEGLMDRIEFVESTNNNDAVSPRGALGYYQIMPKTAVDPGFKVNALSTGEDVTAAPREEQRRFARDYMNAMFARYEGNQSTKYTPTQLALAAYNAGYGKVDDFIKKGTPLPKETVEYIEKFNLQTPAESETGFLDTFKNLVIEPASAASPKLDTSYTISKGDTLGAIAKRYGTSVEELAKLNNISDVNKINLGQKVKLPTGSRVPTEQSKPKIMKIEQATKTKEPIIPHNPFDKQLGIVEDMEEDLNWDLPKMLWWGLLSKAGFDVEVKTEDLDPRTLAAQAKALGKGTSVTNYNQFNKGVAKEQLKVYDTTGTDLEQYQVFLRNLMKTPGKLLEYMKDNTKTAAFVLGRVNIDEDGNVIDEKWNFNKIKDDPGMKGADTPFTAGRAFLSKFMPSEEDGGPVMNVNVFGRGDEKPKKKTRGSR